MKSIHHICLVALLIVIGSCTVQKRNYQKGYYISWFNKKNGENPSKHETTERSTNQIKKTNPVLEIDEPVITSQSTSQEQSLFTSIKKPLISFKDTCGDRIIYKNGDEIIGKVLEVNDSQIKYKRCDNIDGPLFIVSKQKIEMIIYANGVKESITNTPAPPNNSSSPSQPAGPNKTTSPNAITAIALAAVGIFIIPVLGSIISLIFAGIAETEIKSNPTKYEGLEIVKVARIIDWIMIALFVIMLLFIFLLLSMI
jgi:hypothetical protein